MDILDRMEQELSAYGTGPLWEEMPRKSLENKIQNGPTAAHHIEEVHVPENYAYIACTTGSTAFQNLVAVTWEELPARIEAGVKALKMSGVPDGGKLLVTYPPLVAVFSEKAIENCHLEVSFIRRPVREAVLVSVIRDHPHAVIGESSFLRTVLEDAIRINIADQIPKDLILIAAGTPMDPALRDTAEKIGLSKVHDLYGCQEFGWISMDGQLLREDIFLMDGGREDGRKSLFVGGLPTGDCFYTEKPEKKPVIRTETRLREEHDPEVYILSSTAASIETVYHTVKTILRTKARILRADEHTLCKQDETRIAVTYKKTGKKAILEGPHNTRLFDDILRAQILYQKSHRENPAWNKKV